MVKIRSSIRSRAHLHTAPPCFDKCTPRSRGNTLPSFGTHAPRFCARRRSRQHAFRPRWQAQGPGLLSLGPRLTGSPGRSQATSGLAYVSCPALVLRRCHTCGRCLCIYWSWFVLCWFWCSRVNRPLLGGVLDLKFGGVDFVVMSGLWVVNFDDVAAFFQRNF